MKEVKIIEHPAKIRFVIVLMSLNITLYYCKSTGTDFRYSWTNSVEHCTQYIERIGAENELEREKLNGDNNVFVAKLINKTEIISE